MTTASLRAVSVQFTLALVLAATAAAIGPGAAQGANHPPMLASETGWPGELVNRPACGSDHDPERATCESGRR